MIAQDLYSLAFEWSKTPIEPQPDQFITIRVNPSTIPLLHFPFALSDIDGKDFTVSTKETNFCFLRYKPKQAVKILAIYNNIGIVTLTYEGMRNCSYR